MSWWLLIRAVAAVICSLVVREASGRPLVKTEITYLDGDYDYELTNFFF